MRLRPRLSKRIATILLLVTMLFGESMAVLADQYYVTYSEQEKVEVTVEYLREATEAQANGTAVTKIYHIVANQMQECLKGANITFSDTDLENFTLDKVVVVPKDTRKSSTTYDNISKIPDNIIADEDKTIQLYFSPKVKDFFSDVTMFDYDVLNETKSVNIVCAKTTAQSSFTNSVTEFKSITFDGKALPTLNGETQSYYWAWNTYTWEGTQYTDLVLMKVTKQRNNVTGVTKVQYNGEDVTVKDWDKSNHQFNATTSGGTVYNNVIWGNGTSLVTELDGGINSNYYTDETSTGYYAKYLAMGSYGKAQNISLTVNKSGVGSLNANNNNAYISANEDDGTRAIIPGLVDSLGGTNYNTLVMAQGIHEPGYFSAESIPGKTIYDDRFQIQFKQVGDTYTLYRIDDKNVVDAREINTQAINLPYNSIDYSLWNVYNSKAADQGIRKDFFPMDYIAVKEGNGELNAEVYQSEREHTHAHSGACSHNCYFGMRYDLSFSIGEYIGPLEYSFAGDDDLWVFVDGELVLDLGGMHSAYPTASRYNDKERMVTNPKDPYEVDLWGVILKQAGLLGSSEMIKTLSEEAKAAKIAEFNNNAAAKEQSHRLTILYMERGGYDSSCYMHFTIPNVGNIGSVIQKQADFELVKRDSVTQNVIPNVGFTLYSDEACTSVVRESYTNAEGLVRFSNLPAGTYYLKETSWDTNAYVADANKYKVTVTVDGLDSTATVEGLTIDENGVYVVYNTPIPNITLEFHKVNQYTQAALSGAEFLLKKDNANGEVIASAVSDTNGYFSFAGIKAGTYYLEEISAPCGYVTPDSGWTIQVSESSNGLVYTVTGANINQNQIANEPYVSFEFTKIDSVTNEAISDVIFTLYEGINNSKTNKVATVTSDADGKVRFDGLRVGQEYLLVETKPVGYVAVETPWVIRVDYENGNYVQKIFVPTLDGASNEWKYDVKTLDVSRIIRNTPATGELKITKTIDQINMVYGAPTFTFMIEGPDDLVMYRTITFESADNKEKTIVLKDLPLGEYTVTELSNVRYALVSATVVNNNKTVTEEYTPEFCFRNELKSDDDYSHSDVVVNSFRMNDEGDIEISKNRHVVE